VEEPVSDISDEPRTPPLWGPLSAREAVPAATDPIEQVQATPDPADEAEEADGRDLRLWAGGALVAIVLAAAVAMSLAPEQTPAEDQPPAAAVAVEPAPSDAPTAFADEPTPTFTGDPTPTSAADALPPTGAAALVDITAVAGDANASGVARTLGEYFDGINSRDYERSFRTYTFEQQQRITYEAWSRGVSTSQDTAVRIAALVSQPDGSVVADVYFTSTQDAALGPNPGETCTHWSLVYTMAPNVDPNLPFLIGRVQKIGPGHQSC
jgi:hypothetical protein